MKFVIAAAALAVAAAQDPAPGWLGYATAQCPTGTVVTNVSAWWPVGATPRTSQSFYSPWFGIDASDNLNLLQPVNPWMGNEWLIYNEYYQWQPSYNQNSAQHKVKAGDMLYGSISLNPGASPSYTIYHNTTTGSGWEISMTIPNQAGANGKPKEFNIIYFVYEKVAPCGDYPPDGSVTFSNIQVYCNNQLTTPTWTTAYVEDVCNNRATIVDANTIKITWNTKAEDPSQELIAASQNGPRAFGIRAAKRSLRA